MTETCFISLFHYLKFQEDTILLLGFEEARYYRYINGNIIYYNYYVVHVVYM
jgi:hypothetical protein